MTWVEFTKDTDLFPKGSVRNMDEESAKSVVARKVAKLAENAPEADVSWAVEQAWGQKPAPVMMTPVPSAPGTEPDAADPAGE